MRSVQQMMNKKKEREVTASDSSKPTTKTESSLKSKLETQTEQKDKARAKYLEAVNYFNDNVKDTYFCVSFKLLTSDFLKKHAEQ